MVVVRRQEWVDAWRGLLIILVVLGHASGGAFHLQPPGVGRDAFDLVYDVIYAFHMPAFFCLAGYLWPEARIDAWGFIKKRFLRLMVPYFTFGVFSILVYHLALGGFNSARVDFSDSYYVTKGASDIWGSLCGLLSMGAWPAEEAYRYNSVLWFLPCMFLVQILFLQISRILQSVKVRLFVCLLLLTFAVLARVHMRGCYPMALERVPTFLLVMVLGWSCSRGTKNEDAPVRGFWRLLVGLCIVAFVLLRSLMPNTYLSYESYRWAVVFIALSVVGSILSAAAAKAYGCRLLLYVGRSALTIMLFHKFVVVGLELGVPWSRGVLKGPCWVAVVYTLVLTLVSVAFCFVVDVFLKRIMPWSIGYNGVRRMKEREDI